MILEHAVLDVIPGQERVFEAAFAEARPLIASSPGFVSVDLDRCVERANRYLLRVHWRSVEDHTVGFRRSPAFEEWRRLLHHFYQPLPTVEHFEPVGGVGSEEGGDPPCWSDRVCPNCGAVQPG